MKQQSIGQIREQLNMRPMETARKLGISYTYLYSIENGLKKPSDTIKRKICNLYGIDMNTLFLALEFSNSK